MTAFDIAARASRTYAYIRAASSHHSCGTFVAPRPRHPPPPPSNLRPPLVPVPPPVPVHTQHAGSEQAVRALQIVNQEAPRGAHREHEVIRLGGEHQIDERVRGAARAPDALLVVPHGLVALLARDVREEDAPVLVLPRFDGDVLATSVAEGKLFENVETRTARVWRSS